ncbi:hypothetical protein SCG7086_AG_00270 [Chlamydiales bacterium SCGC AG-110-P3]|nr:hypothetical protein SCG7086_AG_00270 [Chlamydiales bacterium SCGC AG-110-P3]
MPELQRQEDDHKRQNEKSELLKSSMEKLKERGESHLRDRYGFSSDFLAKVQSQERAMELCEKAMETLADDYVEALVQFKEATEATHALEALEKGEALWQGEASIIRYFDKEGGEAQFLNGIREQTFVVLQDRLETSADTCTQHPTPENVALCLAILSVMDSVLGEMGVPPVSPERERLRDIARAFV